MAAPAAGVDDTGQQGEVTRPLGRDRRGRRAFGANRPHRVAESGAKPGRAAGLRGAGDALSGR